MGMLLFVPMMNVPGWCNWICCGFGHQFALSCDVVPGLSEKQIAIKELFPKVVALELWGAHLANQNILFMSDNAAVVHAINKQTCKEKTLMHLIRRLVLSSLSFNILF